MGASGVTRVCWGRQSKGIEKEKEKESERNEDKRQNMELGQGTEDRVS